MRQIDRGKPKCPSCGRVIPGDDVNVADDIAYCRSCNLSHKFTAVIRNAELTSGIDLNQPPPGIRCDLRGGRIFISASHRSFSGAAASLGIALFWNGIVSVFVLIAIAGTLENLHISIPTWFPAPNMEGDSMGVGMTVFLWLFLSPFILIGMGMITAFLLSLGGRTEVRIERNQGTVFTGIGPIGRRRRFSVSKVSDVRLDSKQWRDSDGDRQRRACIVIETHDGKLIRFASTLSADRQRFVAALLRKNLLR